MCQLCVTAVIFPQSNLIHNQCFPKLLCVFMDWRCFALIYGFLKCLNFHFCFAFPNCQFENISANFVLNTSVFLDSSICKHRSLETLESMGYIKCFLLEICKSKVCWSQCLEYLEVSSLVFWPLITAISLAQTKTWQTDHKSSLHFKWSLT